MTSTANTTEQSTAALPPSRLHSLDGLRGIAALVVLIHHALLVVPSLAELTLNGTRPAFGSPSWLFTYTPAHLVWAGEEAVLVFFVLSGLVLALPATRRPMHWLSYYPRRVLRLYLPVWGAVALAAALIWAIPREASPERSAWLNVRTDVPLSDAWGDALLFHNHMELNTPLWSLRWEMAFSLLLPIYLIVARRQLRAVAWKLLAILGLIAAGTLLESTSLRYLPIFAIGVLMAYHREQLDAAAAWIEARRRSRLTWAALGALSVVLLTSRWILDGLPVTSSMLDAAGSGGSIVGAGLAVILSMYCPAVRTVLEMRPSQWVGSRSFSLYLIHEPIVISLAFALPVAVSPWATIALAIPVVLVATAAFYRVVEAPSLRLARAAGRRVRAG